MYLSNRQTSLLTCFWSRPLSSRWGLFSIGPARKRNSQSPLDCKNQEGLHWQTAFPHPNRSRFLFQGFSFIVPSVYGDQALFCWSAMPESPFFLKKKKQNNLPHSSISIASSLVGEDAKTKFLSKMGQLTTSSAMLANVFQRKK